MARSRWGILASSLAALGVVGLACSGGGGGGAGGSPTPTGSPSGTATATPTPVPTLTTTGFLYVRPAAYCIAGSANVAACNTLLTVIVQDQATNILSDAQVEIGKSDAPLVLATDLSNGTSYRAYQQGYGDSYIVNVTHGTASTLGFVMRSPADFSLSIPSLTASTPAQITWTPSGDPDAIVNVAVSDPSSNATYVMNGLTDSGAHQIPGTAFPSPGVYTILLSRRVPTPAPNGVFGNVTLERRQTATVN